MSDDQPKWRATKQGATVFCGDETIAHLPPGENRHARATLIAASLEMRDACERALDGYRYGDIDPEGTIETLESALAKTKVQGAMR